MHDQSPPPESRLGYLLTQVSFLKQRITNTALRELDITYIQFIILAGTLELGNNNRIVTQQDISRERRLNKAMVSNVVKHLIEKGLMIREQHPDDKRAYTLSLTQAGSEAAIRGREIALEIDHSFFAKVNAPELLDTFTTLLENEGGEDE